MPVAVRLLVAQSLVEKIVSGCIGEVVSSSQRNVRPQFLQVRMGWHVACNLA